MIKAQDFNETVTTAKHTLGTRFFDESTGKEYVYVQAGEALTSGDAVVVDGSFSAVQLTKTDADKLYPIGVVNTDFSSSEYGWVQIYGATSVSALANCAAEVPLYTSATAGAVDDTSTSQTLLNGIVLTSACGASPAVTACFLNYPVAVRGTVES